MGVWDSEMNCWGPASLVLMIARYFPFSSAHSVIFITCVFLLGRRRYDPVADRQGAGGARRDRRVGARAHPRPHQEDDDGMRREREERGGSSAGEEQRLYFVGRKWGWVLQVAFGHAATTLL